MSLRQAYKAWLAYRSDAARSKELGTDSIALGFGWRAANVGGVRRHLECIEKYSRHRIALYPSNRLHDLLTTNDQRVAYHRGLDETIINRHRLFHSHVDPNFIRLSQQAQRSGKPWLHTYHLLYFPEDWNHRLLPWQEEYNRSLLEVAKNADLCLSVGTWLVDWLEEHHGIQSQYVPNGVDIIPCDSAVPDRFVDRFRLNNFILFANSISGVKNPIAFIEAARRFPDHDFVMIGTGLTLHSIEQNLKTEIPRNLHPLGPLPHADTLDAIAACRVFLMTSHREGLPTVLLEAMAMSKACVIPDAPWSRDAVASRLHGLAYEPRSIDDMDAKIREALSQPQFEHARSRVESMFTWPVVAAQLDSIYDQLGASSGVV